MFAVVNQNDHVIEIWDTEDMALAAKEEIESGDMAGDDIISIRKATRDEINKYPTYNKYELGTI